MSILTRLINRFLKKKGPVCPNHSQDAAAVTCGVCDKLYCQSCVHPFKTLHFCQEHLDLVKKHEWVEVLNLKTSPKDPEEGVRLYDAKKRFFEEMNIPTFVETHYKINFEQDYIETHLILFSIKENLELTRNVLKDFIK